jgi:hypothetical protein
MRSVLLAIFASTLTALAMVHVMTPEPLARRVKVSTAAAVLERKHAMVDCMTYLASVRVGLGVRDRAVDEACESLADEFVNTLPSAPEPTPAPGEVSL